ncbi:hypothetical protein H5410_043877 [Solanum commersonii]|uniref:Uncharacterized protein n=1 Tax=Solanum commersonii TaxID=4109 RepID=A0A9J5XYE7_SOLCO|nr:hypothetical protein H5410_043877 [Solanum commersonii]
MEVPICTMIHRHKTSRISNSSCDYSMHRHNCVPGRRMNTIITPSGRSLWAPPDNSCRVSKPMALSTAMREE